MLYKGIVVLQDNDPSHLVAATKELLGRFVWEIIYPSPYSPDLDPRDFHLLP